MYTPEIEALTQRVSIVERGHDVHTQRLDMIERQAAKFDKAADKVIVMEGRQKNMEDDIADIKASQLSQVATSVALKNTLIGSSATVIAAVIGGAIALIVGLR